MNKGLGCQGWFVRESGQPVADCAITGCVREDELNVLRVRGNPITLTVLIWPVPHPH